MTLRFCSALVLALALVACDGGGPSPTDGGPGADGGGNPPADDIVRMCMLNNACQYQSLLGLAADLCTNRVLNARQNNVVTYSPEQTLRHARMIECARTATSCDEYIDCAGFGGTCSGTVAGSCQGTIADRCSTPGDNYLPPLFDCALLGMTCSNAMCELPASAPDCTADHCDGDTLVLCRPREGGDQGELRVDCPSGNTCVSDGSAAACMPPMNSCAAESAACEGNVAVWCIENGGSLVEIRSDCGAAGRVCMPDARGVARCMPTGTECTPAGDGPSTARCDGNTLEVCVEGYLQRLDCASVGRTTCGPVPGIPGVQADTVGCM